MDGSCWSQVYLQAMCGFLDACWGAGYIGPFPGLYLHFRDIYRLVAGTDAVKVQERTIYLEILVPSIAVILGIVASLRLRWGSSTSRGDWGHLLWWLSLYF